MSNYQRLLNGFISTMKEDVILSFQEREGTMNTFNVTLTEQQISIMDCFLSDVLVDINYDGDMDESIGGGMYIGLMYDPLDTPLNDVDIDCHGEINGFISDDNADTLDVEFHFNLNQTVYS